METGRACAAPEIENSPDSDLTEDSNLPNETKEENAQNTEFCMDSTSNLLQSEQAKIKNELTTVQSDNLAAVRPDLCDNNAQIMEEPQIDSDPPSASENPNYSSFVKGEETLMEKPANKQDSNKITEENASGPNPTENEDDYSNIVDEAIDDQNKLANYDNEVKTGSEDSNNSPYYIKWIMWKGLKTAIVTQNDNGPCPLLAIINILLLRRTISFPPMQEMVTTQQLMEYLGDVVLKEIPENMGEGAQRNYEQNVQDTLSILPKLKTGLDVNVKFTGVGDFEFTPECGIFDLLSIKLYHGWLFDPQCAEYKDAVGNLSYNQLVEKIVACKEANNDSDLSTGLCAESFLQETAHQLTYHGVCELNAKLIDDELCVFFRNNHFSTLYKQKGELFVLLTDQGFLTEDKMVWQTLSSVHGDGSFVDCDFKTTLTKSSSCAEGNAAWSQEDQDYMIALSIQDEEQQQNQPETLQGEQHANSQPTTSPELRSQESQLNQANNVGMTEQELFDLQYALQLQEEEEGRATREQQQQTQPQRGSSRQQTSSSTPQVHGNIQQRQPGREVHSESLLTDAES